jgi:hypothetical protein
MVEPDQPPPSGGRSWLIYVVGTNLSENHPALTTPSLFTDVRMPYWSLSGTWLLILKQNPTYEDMILLSSLLGPAKPPVASQTDVNSAGGLFRLVEYAGSLVAEAVEGAGAIQIQDGERCLICLSDYEVAEEVRELGKCKHVFHKDCIDQVRYLLPILLGSVRFADRYVVVVNHREKLLSSLPKSGCQRNPQKRLQHP